MVTDKKYEIDDPLFDKKNDILVNKLGITDKEELELIEKEHLINAYRKAGILYAGDHSFSEEDICFIHKIFLGDIYDWAGTYRTVDLSSVDIRYCHAAYISENMKTFATILTNSTPFTPEENSGEILRKLAIIHGELIVIHPFRDGNGRMTRLLCDLLLMQAEYRPMKATAFYNKSFVNLYHKAIQKVWHSKDYRELSNLFESLISP